MALKNLKIREETHKKIKEYCSITNVKINEVVDMILEKGIDTLKDTEFYKSLLEERSKENV